MKRKKLFLTFIFIAILSLFGNVNAQTNNSDSTSESNENKVYEREEVDQKVKIIKTFRVRVKNLLKVCRGNSFLVKLKIVFHKTRQVTFIEMTEKSNCEAYNDAAIEAARKTKFEPATKNGKLVSQFSEVEYKTELSL